jgi:hypothetical protein
MTCPNGCAPIVWRAPRKLVVCPPVPVAAHDDVHYALSHVPEPRELSDPRAHFLDRFLRTTLGFLPRVLSGAVLQAMFLFPLSAGYGRNVLVVNLQSLMFVLAATV